MAKRKFTGKKTTSAELYQEIADSILEALEGGVRPWESCYEVTQGGFAKRVTGGRLSGELTVCC